MRNLRVSNFGKILNILSIIAILATASLPLLAMGQTSDPPIFGGAGSSGINTNFEESSTFTELVVKILNILLAIVGLVAVLFLVYGAFKYITASGEEESVKKAKSMMINSLIGVVLVLLAFALVRIVANATIGGETGI